MVKNDDLFGNKYDDFRNKYDANFEMYGRGIRRFWTGWFEQNGQAGRLVFAVVS